MAVLTGRLFRLRSMATTCIVRPFRVFGITNIIIALIVVIGLLVFLPSKSTDTVYRFVKSYGSGNNELEEEFIPTGPPKTILFWNDDWGYMKDGVDGLFKELNCPVSNCIMTLNQSKLNEADAVLLHICPLANKKNPVWPTRTNPDQIWIFYTHESPCFRGFAGKWEQLYPEWDSKGFNWTMTYRADSDIPMFYGDVWKRETPTNKNYTEVALREKKLAVWISSHCETFGQREYYIKELRKHMPLDILGECGDPNGCPMENRGYIDDTCMDLVGENYKFFLAFENSFSFDYVTEKFFKTLRGDFVVVVRGAADYTRLGATPEMYINTANFSHPRDLAAYLMKIDKDPALYAKMLEWKNYYDGTSYTPRTRQSWCDLCKKVNQNPMPRKTWTNFKAWFNESECRKPPDLDFVTEELKNEPMKPWPRPAA
ncbi:alpha-(1,3)-fucosyltransferase C [Lingula anatina]|uniref:Fucosyltransferase n=1 Tax=Lingula anatina TaxID=7574 RepID=A0A1S3HGK3_LINAN|nr:alpha-(1,3)-fucosyltransferase C-like [Lingula anatina]XP_013420247.1 alpha-(1,3)-fucosyltransferase C [Lingula anatina]|eukprot:XP_013384154.1 alpha-(1,3)-fucosyltransferase C-like [Lingula anatina]